MRRFLAAVSLIFAALAVQPALAGELQAYRQDTFDKLAAAGTPLVVFVHADWCPVCHVQKPIVEALANSKPYRDVKVLVVDFDKQKDVLRKLGVDRQSTLIAFRGTKEVGRLVGTTQKDLIEVLFQRAAGLDSG